MSEKTKQSWLDSLSVYKDIRMVRILLLGAISGFPWVLIASSLSLWLKEEGLSRSTIGWAGLIFGVYAFIKAYTPKIKPAHPIVDLLSPSSLSHKLKLLAINTQGNPLIAPNKRILTIRISLYTERESSQDCFVFSDIINFSKKMVRTILILQTAQVYLKSYQLLKSILKYQVKMKNLH